MAKKKPPFNQEMSIRGVNRRLFARSPVVQEKLEESRQEFPRYKKDGSLAKKPWVKRQCEVCNQWVGSTKIVIDHIDPVVPPDGFPDHYEMWDRILVFLKRLWCNKSNLQRICDECHQSKTNKERFDRQFLKDQKMLDALEVEIASTDIPKEVVKKALAKFTPKRLLDYPEDFSQRVVNLKQQFGGKKIKTGKFQNVGEINGRQSR